MKCQTSHDWTGPNRVNRHVHCGNCGKIFEIGKAKGSCKGPKCDCAGGLRSWEHHDIRCQVSMAHTGEL